MLTRTATRSTPIPAHLRYVLGAPLLALATAIGAHICIPLPGTPVPITLQTVPIFIAPIAIGAGPGALGMVLYIGLALCGVPVLADHSAGPHIFAGPTAGYLLGFLLAQPAGALAARAFAQPWRSALASILAANIAIFSLGVSWLAISEHLSLPAALAQGLWPFLPADLVKSAAALSATIPLVRLSRN
jgi:biotin transport system substrate-specific component